MPNIVIIAGPNGSGKTTSAPTLVNELLGIKTFVNADTIAAGLSAFDVESVAIEAGRLLLKRLDELVEQSVDFAFETTLASRSFASSVKRWKERNYHVHLIYLFLANSKLARARVDSRVEQGGHDIPDEVIDRRYHRGLSNLVNLYIPIVDHWRVYDSSESRLIPIAKSGQQELHVFEHTRWTTIQGYKK